MEDVPSKFDPAGHQRVPPPYFRSFFLKLWHEKSKLWNVNLKYFDLVGELDLYPQYYSTANSGQFGKCSVVNQQDICRCQSEDFPQKQPICLRREERLNGERRWNTSATSNFVTLNKEAIFQKWSMHQLYLLADPLWHLWVCTHMCMQIRCSVECFLTIWTNIWFYLKSTITSSDKFVQRQ